MRRFHALGLSGCAALAFVFAQQAFAQSGDGERDKPKAPKCAVSVRGEAIYGAYGYDHHVHLHNTCDKPQKCKVTGNANPEGVEVTLAAKEKRDVLIFRGSPASEVAASAKCDDAAAK